MMKKKNSIWIQFRMVGYGQMT